MSDLGYAPIPKVGAWRLIGAYVGFEVVRFTTDGNDIVLGGTTIGVDNGVPWNIRYTIHVDQDWHVRRASLTDDLGARLDIQSNGAGSWSVNGDPDPALRGCLDVDLEASVVTNTLPVHRLALSVGEQGDSSAAYIRTVGLTVERLDQTYRRPRGCHRVGGVERATCSVGD